VFPEARGELGCGEVVMGKEFGELVVSKETSLFETIHPTGDFYVDDIVVDEWSEVVVVNNGWRDEVNG
jgi:hypothetical protein